MAKDISEKNIGKVNGGIIYKDKGKFKVVTGDGVPCGTYDSIEEAQEAEKSLGLSGMYSGQNDDIGRRLAKNYNNNLESGKYIGKATEKKQWWKFW